MNYKDELYYQYCLIKNNKVQGVKFDTFKEYEEYINRSEYREDFLLKKRNERKNTRRNHLINLFRLKKEMIKWNKRNGKKEILTYRCKNYQLTIQNKFFNSVKEFKEFKDKLELQRAHLKDMARYKDAINYRLPGSYGSGR